MVFLFLRDWRSALVVVLNIPLALTAALVALWLCGHSINIMTLGGLALAVGVLVDESTVAVENIHAQLKHATSVSRAVHRGTTETAVPRLLAMLCILAVFIPSFFMQGPVRALFVPLSLAVGFAMVASWFLSSTFVPVLAAWLFRPAHSPVPAENHHISSFARFAAGYRGMLDRLLPLRWPLTAGYVVAAGAAIVFVGGSLGQEVFPTIDAGQFQLRLRARKGRRSTPWRK